VAPHEDKKDSQSYYFENNEEEDMQSAYQLQYVVLGFDWLHSG
jgi:hypothetical protein